MKKQFIAIILTVAMLVSMGTMFIVPAAAEEAGNVIHKVAFSSPNIVVDGLCDTAYVALNEESVKSIYKIKDTSDKELGFEGYMIANEKGVYVWMNIVGEKTYVNNPGETPGTPSNAPKDYMQIYYNMSAAKGQKTHYASVKLDYHGNQTGSYQYAAVKTENGWSGELFIPWMGGSPAATAAAEGRTDFYFAIGFQYNDDRDGTGGYDCAVYDDYTTSYWSDYSLCPVVEFNDDYMIGTGGGDGGSAGFNGAYGAIYTENAPTLDGDLDYLYMKGTKISAASTLGSPSAGANGLQAYVMATKEGFYVWAKVADKTFFKDNNNTGDYLQIYYNMSENAASTKSYGYVQVDYNGGIKIRESSGSSTSWPSASTAGVKVKTVKEADCWIAEVFCPWRKGSPAATAMAAGKYDECFFTLGLQANDDTDGNKSWNYVYYDSASGGSYWSDYSIIPQIGFIYDDGKPSVMVSEKISFAKELTFGKALQNAKMRYTLTSNGNVIHTEEVEGVKTKNNTYLFRYDVAPQYMSAKFTAELVNEGVVFASMEKDYSVLDYYMDLLSKTSLDLGLSPNQHTAMQKLIYNTLNYGAAAQRFAGVDTDNLVNNGYENMASLFVGVNSYADVYTADALEGYNAEFISMGLNYDSINRMYVKFTADDVSKIRVTFSDNQPGVAEQLTIYKVAGEDNTYIAYSPLIAPEDYDTQYTFRLIYKDSDWNNIIVQKAYCNVNAYLEEIIEESDNYNMVELAKATYLYGVAARSYKAS